MVKNSICLVLFVILSEAACWVFNNVNFKELAKSLQDDELLDLEFEELLIQERLALIFPVSVIEKDVIKKGGYRHLNYLLKHIIGTKWCGAGNVADNFDDLGPSRETDKCCRDHDTCPDLIEPGETKHNLTNDAFYTRLSCQCDMKFGMCLHEVDSKTSKLIGKTYFNLIGTKCYRRDYPVTRCKKRGGFLNSKCVEYEYDKSGNKTYQWFDVPNY